MFKPPDHKPHGTSNVSVKLDLSHHLPALKQDVSKAPKTRVDKLRAGVLVRSKTRKEELDPKDTPMADSKHSGSSSSSSSPSSSSTGASTRAGAGGKPSRGRRSSVAPAASSRSGAASDGADAPLGKVTKSAAAESSSLFKEVEKKNRMRARAETPEQKARLNTFAVAPAGKSKVEVEVIARFDPSFAQMLLDNTPKTQRTLRPRLVDRYASDMLSGRWRISGDPIRLNAKLELIDGQHRCAAVVKTGITLTDVVLETLYDERAFEVMDQAAPRNLRDIIKMSGGLPVEPTVAAAIIYEHLDFTPRVLSMPEKLQIVALCPHVAELREMATFRIATAGMLAAFLRCLKIDREAALSFYTAAFTNTPLIHGEFEENVRLLATWIYATKAVKRVGKTAEGWKRETLCRCFSAWNAWRQGRVLARIIYNPLDAVPVPV